MYIKLIYKCPLCWEFVSPAYMDSCGICIFCLDQLLEEEKVAILEEEQAI